MGDIMKTSEQILLDYKSMEEKINYNIQNNRITPLYILMDYIKLYEDLLESYMSDFKDVKLNHLI